MTGLEIVILSVAVATFIVSALHAKALFKDYRERRVRD